MTQPATVGSQLLYTYMASDHCASAEVGKVRPAMVVRDWGSCYNILVFCGPGDFKDGRLVASFTSIQLGECPAKGRLHWAGSPLEHVECEHEPVTETEPAPPPAEEPHVVTSPFPQVAQASAPKSASESSSAGELNPVAEPQAAPKAPKKKPGKRK